MPPSGDIARFLGGQTFGKAPLPNVNLTGKTIIVTGSNTGLGFECAKHLVKSGLSQLVVACRNLEKGEAAKSRILKDVADKHKPCKIEVWQVDMCNYQSVLAFIDRVKSGLVRLDGFIANAGVEMYEFELAEGLELTLTVNVVSTYLMSVGVLPKLEETSSKFKTQTNLSVVGSMMHTFGPDSQLEVPKSQDILDVPSNSSTAQMANRYPLSKLMIHQCFHQFVHRASARTNSGENAVVVNLLNPGWCASELDRHKKSSLPQKAIFAVIGRTAEEGSRTLVHAITAGRETHDRYLSECQVKAESQFVQSVRGRRLSERLWTELVQRFDTISPDVAAIVR